MHRETIERVQKVRSEVLAGKAAISDLKTQLAGNDDKPLKQLLRRVWNSFDDVESLFVGILADERMPPRTLTEESNALDFAEFYLERIASVELKGIQDMVEKFGPNMRSIG